MVWKPLLRKWNSTKLLNQMDSLGQLFCQKLIISLKQQFWLWECIVKHYKNRRALLYKSPHRNISIHPTQPNSTNPLIAQKHLCLYISEMEYQSSTCLLQFPFLSSPPASLFLFCHVFSYEALVAGRPSLFFHTFHARTPFLLCDICQFFLVRMVLLCMLFDISNACKSHQAYVTQCFVGVKDDNAGCMLLFML